MPEETTETQRSAPKSLIVIGCVALILVLSSLVPARWFGISSMTYKNKPLDLYTLPSVKEIAEDTDGDGIISWQEVVHQNNNLTLNENNDQEEGVNEDVINVLNNPNNLTSSFSKNLYITSLYLQKNGLTDKTYTESALKELVAQEAEKIIPTTFSLSDLTIASSETKNSLKFYGNSIAPLLDKVVTENDITRDLSSINSFSQSNNKKDLIPLEENVVRLNLILQKILALSVPPSAVPYHILFLNRVALYRDTVLALAGASVDPVRATIAMQKYTDTVVLAVRTISQFTNYFTEKNIIFSAQDAGYVFTSGYTTK